MSDRFFMTKFDYKITLTPHEILLPLVRKSIRSPVTVSKIPINRDKDAVVRVLALLENLWKSMSLNSYLRRSHRR